MGLLARASIYYTTEEYFDLVRRGLLREDDRTELLEGVIVAMSPQSTPHAAAVSCVSRALGRAVGRRAAVRSQLPYVAGGFSVPEPDLAVVPGREADYLEAHPSTALLLVEVAVTSLVQDKLTKTRIYGAAGVPEYWIVNLRDDCVLVHRGPDPSRSCYRDERKATRCERLELVSLPGVRVRVSDLLPRKR